MTYHSSIIIQNLWSNPALSTSDSRLASEGHLALRKFSTQSKIRYLGSHFSIHPREGQENITGLDITMDCKSCKIHAEFNLGGWIGCVCVWGGVGGGGTILPSKQIMLLL